MPFQLPKLPYDTSDLEPYIDQKNDGDSSRQTSQCLYYQAQ